MRRIATDLPVREDVPVTVEWDGDDDAGGTVPDGFYNVRVSLRHGGRAATLLPAAVRRHAGAAARPCSSATAGSPGPVAGEVAFRAARRLRRFPTQMQVLRTDLAAPEVVARFELPAGRAQRAAGTAARTARRRRPGTYQIVSAVRDSAGNVGRSAPPVGRQRARPRHARA